MKTESGTNIVLFHYPNNPSGKTLSEAEAKQVGETMNKVVAHQKNTLLVQEDIYIATTHPDDAIVTPSKYFDAEALQHLVLIHSMSKAGHPQERTGVIAVPNNYVAKYISSAISFLTLGSSSTDFIGVATTLKHIADGGLKKRSESGDPNNYRYKIADYYQKRMEIVSKGLVDIEGKLRAAGVEVKSPILNLLNPDLAVEEGQEFRKYTPRGCYYLFPNFECLRGREIPEAMRAAPYFENRAQARIQDGKRPLCDRIQRGYKNGAGQCAVSRAASGDGRARPSVQWRGFDAGAHFGHRSRHQCDERHYQHDCGGHAGYAWRQPAGTPS